MVKAIGIRLSDNSFYPVWTPSDKKTKRTLISLENNRKEIGEEGVSLEFFESQDQNDTHLIQIASLPFADLAKEFEVFIALEDDYLYLLARSTLGEEQKIELDYLNLPYLSQWDRDLVGDNREDIFSIDEEPTDIENFSLDLDQDEDFSNFLKGLNNESLSFLDDDSQPDSKDIFKDKILNDVQKEFSDQNSDLFLEKNNPETFLKKENESESNGTSKSSQKEDLPWGEEKPLDVENLIEDSDADEGLLDWNNNWQSDSKENHSNIYNELDTHIENLNDGEALLGKGKEDFEQANFLEEFLLDDFSFTSEESLEKDIQKAVRETIKDGYKEEKFSYENGDFNNQFQEGRRNQFFLSMALFPLAFFVLFLGTLFFYQNSSSLSYKKIEDYDMDWTSSQFQKNASSWGNSEIDNRIDKFKTSIKKTIETSFENLTRDL